MDGRQSEDTELDGEFQTPTKKEPEGTNPEASFPSLKFKRLDYTYSQNYSTLKGPQCHCPPLTQTASDPRQKKGGEDTKHPTLPANIVSVRRAQNIPTPNMQIQIQMWRNEVTC